MKHFIFALTMFALIGAFCVFNFRFIDANLQIISEDISAAERNVTEERWEEAVSDIERAMEKWQRDKRYFSLVLRHGALDEITSELEGMIKCIGERDKTEFLLGVSEVRALVKGIADIESLSLGNVF